MLSPRWLAGVQYFVWSLHDRPTAVTATRLLVLGIVRGYGRVHGYRVGTDLLSWGASEWANVKWGSIYYALRSLTQAGFLHDFDEVPGRTEYALSERGQAEFTRLLRDALRRSQPRPDLLGAALALLPALPREEAIYLLRERLASLQEARQKARLQISGWAGPPHVLELFKLWEHNATRDAHWTQQLIERLESGTYALLAEPDSPGEPGSWWTAVQVDQ
jgi:DNA-binding PadR family transcriptional regulator